MKIVTIILSEPSQQTTRTVRNAGTTVGAAQKDMAREIGSPGHQAAHALVHREVLLGQVPLAPAPQVLAELLHAVTAGPERTDRACPEDSPPNRVQLRR